MFNGKPIAQLSKGEMEKLIAELVEAQEVNEREAQRLQEEKEKVEAAKQLTAMSVNHSERQVNTIVSGTVGSLPEFSAEGDEWSLWYERFEQYCVANVIEQERKVSSFLTLIGNNAYSLLRDLCAPRKLNSFTVEELNRIMKSHVQPVPNVITERYKFKGYKQRENEDIKKYVANLKKLAMLCDYGNSLEDNLRDQFVFGVSSEAIKKKLLSERELSFQRATEIAQSLEAASRDAAQMQGDQVSQSASGINAVRDKTIEGKQASVGRETNSCYCCGRPNHIKANCRFKNYICNRCGKLGHLRSVCTSKDNSSSLKQSKPDFVRKTGNRESQHFVEECDLLSERLDTIFSIQGTNSVDSPMFVNVLVEKKSFAFEIDTGSPITAFSENMFKQSTNLQKLNLEKTDRSFKAFNGNSIVPIGVLHTNVQFSGYNKNLQLFILPGTNSTPIIGRNWLRELNIIHVNNDECSVNVNSLQPNSGCNETVAYFKEKYKDVFAEKIGLYKGKTFKLYLKPEAKPVFCKPRSVPLAMREKLERDLDRLEKANTIEPIESSPWGTPIVPLLKSNGELRVCGDFKVTLNPQLVVDKYPIPRPADLLAQLDKGEIYSEIDLSHAYEQFGLDEESKNLTTISTHKGLYRYNSLPYGVASAPSLFQREMEEIFRGMRGVAVYFDNIYVSGRTREEHDKNLEEVLKRLQEKGLTVKFEKCKFAVSCVDFLGFKLDKSGLRVSESKTKAVREMKAPSDVKELQSFLGAINHYSSFIKNLSIIISPLCELLRNNVEWQWTKEREKAFQEAKASLVSPEVLAHYDANLPIIITCDASPKGLGAVISHVFPREVRRPIAFASKVLSRAEENYSQLDREALALVFGVKTFHQYVYGRKFLLETDHKPLVYIFGPKKGIPQMAASRVQRWAVFLAGYDFEIKHISGESNGPADALSRVLKNFKSEQQSVENEEYSYLNFVCEETEMINAEVVKSETMRDAVLQKVLNFVMIGWPAQVSEVFNTYRNKQSELTVENGIIMWGHRVVLPSALVPKFLEELHSAHGGIVKMKALARSLVWWHSIDKDIENLVKSCELCQQDSNSPPRSILHTWPWPNGPNERIHLDFCGPVEGNMYLVSVDAYSKWVEIREVPNITAATTVKMLKEYISVWGIPNEIVSDNGPAFIADEFELFLIRNNIKHVLSPPYHPASNGIAENSVKSFKSHFKKLVKSNSRHDALHKYLLFSRSTPHCTTGVSPAELQLGRKIRTRLDIIDAVARKRVEYNQEKQRSNYNGNRRTTFKINDLALTKNYSTNKWEKIVVADKLGPVTYNVRTEDNRLWKRHLDQLRTCESYKYAKPEKVTSSVCEQVRPDVASSVQPIDNAVIVNDPKAVTATGVFPSETANENVTTASTDDCTAADKPAYTNVPPPAANEVRRSMRARKPVNRLNL